MLRSSTTRSAPSVPSAINLLVRRDLRAKRKYPTGAHDRLQFTRNAAKAVVWRSRLSPGICVSNAWSLKSSPSNCVETMPRSCPREVADTKRRDVEMKGRTFLRDEQDVQPFIASPVCVPKFVVDVWAFTREIADDELSAFDELGNFR
jgi:hypothetical protein